MPGMSKHFKILRDVLEEERENREFITDYEIELEKLNFDFTQIKNDIKSQSKKDFSVFLEKNKETINKLKEIEFFEISIDDTSLSLFSSDVYYEEPFGRVVVNVNFADKYSPYYNKDHKILVDINNCESIYIDGNTSLETIINKAIEFYEKEREDMLAHVEVYNKIKTQLEEVIK